MALNHRKKQKNLLINISTLKDCLPKVNNGEYYFTDLIGLDVYIGNIKIGKITDVNNHGAGDYCEVKKNWIILISLSLKDHVKEVNIN